MPLPREAYRVLNPLLDRAGRVAILTHVNPDGDGVGSALALGRFLKRRGIDARFIINRPLGAGLRFLAADDEAIPYQEATCSAFVRGADLLFMLDNAALSRLGPLEADVHASGATRVCVDHHLVREPFWTINLVDEEACSTGEMVHDLIRAVGGELTAEIAEPIYVAILTDTGSFRFPRTTSRIHRIVADLLDLGVKPHEIHQQIHERKSLGLMRLIGEALARARFGAGHRLAWVEVSMALLEECDATGEEDLSEIVNHLLSIEGVEIGLLLREQEDGSTRLSLRSKPQHDVNALARAYGGGGHKNAAGAQVGGSPASVAPRLIAQAEAALG